MAVGVTPPSGEAGTVTPSPRLSVQQRSAVLSLLQTLDPGGGSSGSGSGSGSRHENSRQRKHRKKVRYLAHPSRTI